MTHRDKLFYVRQIISLVVLVIRKVPCKKKLIINFEYDCSDISFLVLLFQFFPFVILFLLFFLSLNSIWQTIYTWFYRVVRSVLRYKQCHRMISSLSWCWDGNFCSAALRITCLNVSPWRNQDSSTNINWRVSNWLKISSLFKSNNESFC